MDDYLIVTMKVTPYSNVSIDDIKKEIEDCTTNLPYHNLLSKGGRVPLGRIHDVKVNCYPKKPL